jgi:hypothetical protein
MIEGSGSGAGSVARIRTSNYRIRIQEALKHMDPTDPDPQH